MNEEQIEAENRFTVIVRAVVQYCTVQAMEEKLESNLNPFRMLQSELTYIFCFC